MHRNNARIALLLGAATSLGVACAADPGDTAKATSGLKGGSTSSSGVGGSSSSSSGGSSSGPASGTSSSGYGPAGSGSSGYGPAGSGSGSSGGSGVGGSTSSGVGGSSSGGGSSGAGSSSGSTGGSSSGVATMDAGSPNCITLPKSAAVAYYTADKAPFTAVQTVQFDMQISNAGFATLNLSDVTVRYWFTADGNALSGIVFQSYYSQNGSVDITKSLKAVFMPAPPQNVTPTSDSYLEFSFGATSGTLTALSGGGAQVQATFHGPYSPPALFNESNDYSFDATKKSAVFQPWPNITAYVKGQLVYGCEPQGGAAGSSSSGGSSGSSGSSSSGGGGSDAGSE